MTNSKSIPKRILGSSGVAVSEIGLGCMGMSPGFMVQPTRPRASQPSAPRSMRGITLIDTGDFYGMGHNEMLIRRALEGVPRSRVVISVKFGALRDPAGAVDRQRRPAAGGEEFPRLHAAAPGHRLHRRLPPGARRSGGADRRHHRRDRRHGPRRLCPPHRAVRSRRRNHPPRACRPSDRRFANRIFADEPRHRGRNPADDAATRHSASPPMACCRADC